MKRGDEPFGEFALRSVECRDDVRDDILADEDVSLHGEVRFGHMAGPRQRLRAGPCGGAPRRVDDAELAVIAPFVRSEQHVERRLRIVARAEEGEACRSE